MEEKKNRNSASKIAANNRYVEKAYDRLTLRVKKGELEEIKRNAGTQSVNDYIRTAIREKMNPYDIPELSIYAKQLKMSPDEYIRQAIIEKMQKQDKEAEEQEEVIPFFD